jgi:hypothetical protein
MKARPILMSAPMIRALLDGRKTQTRRIVKERYIEFLRPTSSDDPSRMKPCPYGQPGDLLWVRETWSPSVEPENHVHARLGFTYRADWDHFDDMELRDFRWKPSLHMPRIASRLTLEITGVRIERLKDINEEDAIAEGCDDSYLVKNKCQPPHSRAYRYLWEDINGHGSWDANPWVWCLSFSVINRNIDNVIKDRAHAVA